MAITQQKKKRIVDKEKHKEYQARYHQKNPGLKAKWNKDWISRNRERFNASKYHYRDRVKREVISFYSDGSMSCNYCGFSNIDALCVDHIDNDGSAWRKENGCAGRGMDAGTNTFELLRKMGFPKGMQILCANCNLIKEIQRKQENRLKNKWYKHD